MRIEEILGPDEGVGFWRDLAGVAWAGLKILMAGLVIIWGIPLLAFLAITFLY